MAGAAKARAKKEREAHCETPSSNGESSSSGKASSSAPRSESHSRSTSANARAGSTHSHSDSRARSRSHYDGNKDPDVPGASGSRNPNSSAVIVNPRNIDLGMSAWSVVRGYDVPSNLPRRPPQTSKLGVEKVVGLNTFNVDSFPTQKVYQFEIQIGSGAEKRGLITKVWESKTLKKELGPGWIFDGETSLILLDRLTYH